MKQGAPKNLQGLANKVDYMFFVHVKQTLSQNNLIDFELLLFLDYMYLQNGI